MRQALGRGLDALIPKEQESLMQKGDMHSRISRVEISKIRVNRFQPRKNFDPERLSELAQSIKEHGLAQPIIVSYQPETDHYELIAGERRLKAAQLAGLSEIEAVIRNSIPDQKRFILSIIENIQREDLNPIEKAHGYQRLIKEFNVSQTELGRVLGKAKPTISNTLRLLELPEEAQSALQTGQITEGHAKALLQAKDPLQIKNLLGEILGKNLSVRETEEAAGKSSDGPIKESGRPKNFRAQQKPADISAIESSLQQTLGTRVDIRTLKDHSRGTIKIHFYSASDFERIIGFIKR